MSITLIVPAAASPAPPAMLSPESLGGTPVASAGFSALLSLLLAAPDSASPDTPKQTLAPPAEENTPQTGDQILSSDALVLLGLLPPPAAESSPTAHEPPPVAPRAPESPANIAELVTAAIAFTPIESRAVSSAIPQAIETESSPPNPGPVIQGGWDAGRSSEPNLGMQFSKDNEPQNAPLNLVPRARASSDVTSAFALLPVPANATGADRAIIAQTVTPTTAIPESIGAREASPWPSLAAPPQVAATRETEIRSPVTSPAWREAFVSQVNLLVSERVQAAEIRLHPRDLGPVEIRIAMNDQQTNITFSAPLEETRRAIEDALPRLREVLADAGVNLEHTSVGGEREREQWAENAARERENARDRKGDGMVGSSDAPPPLPTRTPMGLVDTFA